MHTDKIQTCSNDGPSIHIHTYTQADTITYYHTNHNQTRPCIYTYTCTYNNTCIHACIHTYSHTYIHTCMHIATYWQPDGQAQNQTYIHTCRHTDGHIYIYIHAGKHTYIQEYRHTYIHTCKHTAIHTARHTRHTGRNKKGQYRNGTIYRYIGIQMAYIHTYTQAGRQAYSHNID